METPTAMTILKKTFMKRAELDAFLAELPPLAFQSILHGAAVMTLSWRTLKLVAKGDALDGQFKKGGRYEVKRETDHHYLIRDEGGRMISINRYTLYSPGHLLHFNYEEAAA
jgi:hypothetical protein